MYSFRNDYSELAHSKILDNLSKYVNEQNIGYGLDKHSKNAEALIMRELSKDINPDIHFLVGGTSCNKIVISHALKPFEAVIAVNSGHINVHEAGAIEAGGHKILLTNGINGKITPGEIVDIVSLHADEHMVYPKMVYISEATEIGTIYSKEELTEIYKTCKRHNLYLYIDGARLGAALTSNEFDFTLEDISKLCDVFYIGGTKNGAIFGEAVVIINDELKPMFRRSIKQNGGMLAKTFAIAIQFEALFTDNLFYSLALHSNKMANVFIEGIKELGIHPTYPSSTNLQFISLEKRQVDLLLKDYDFEIWENKDNTQVIRLVFSWATTISDVEELLQSIKKVLT